MSLSRCTSTDNALTNKERIIFHFHNPKFSKTVMKHSNTLDISGQHQPQKMRSCSFSDDDSEYDIILSSSHLYSLHNYSPELKQERKRVEKAASLNCCGCCPEWWDEVEGNMEYTLKYIKQALTAAFKLTK